ncbi:MAG: hypothetical protein AB8B61_05075, partial [Cyclobacteriaceae bacterium]
MNSKSTHYFSFLIVPFFLSCEEVVELPLPSQQKLLVVDGSITDKDSVFVRLTISGDANEDIANIGVSGATVQLFFTGGDTL